MQWPWDVAGTHRPLAVLNVKRWGLDSVCYGE